MAQMISLVATSITIMMLMNGFAAATTFMVGDNMGWTVPDAPDFYSDWATKHNFGVGDTLEFTFPKGFHNVAHVTKAGYDDCDAGDVEPETDGPVEIVLEEAGPHYFICTFSNGGHCGDGQKLAINVTASAASPAPAAVSPGIEPVSPSPADDESSPSNEGSSSSPVPLMSTFFYVSLIAFVIVLLR